MAFDDLTKEQQKKILEIADKEIAMDNIKQEYKQAKQEKNEKEFKKFISHNGKYSESEVSTSQLQYDKEKVIRVQNNSGQFIERAVVTFDNNYQLAITRPAQIYGSDPSKFDISPRKPDGELDTTLVDPTRLNQDIISNQSLSDINNHMQKIGDIDPNANISDNEPEENNSSRI